MVAAGSSLWLPRALCGLLLAALLVSVDQWSKYVAEAELADGRRIELLGELFGLRLAYNTGAAFSLFTEATVVLTAVASVASVVLVVAVLRSRHLGWSLSLGLLLGGAVGNLIDRFLRDPAPGRGAVVDFLAVPNFPVFNFADCAVVCGAGLVILLSARGTPYRGSSAG